MASQTETAWRAIFEERQLLSDLERHGYGTVTADEIKRIGQREPRLMTKFDTRESRPDTIKKAACTVLPISNGTYVLVRGDGYLDLPERPTPERIPTKALDHLQTLQLFCESEAQVLEVAHTCGLLERFLREKVERTTQGRNRASFSFRFIGDAEHRFDVDGVQVEVDACFEADRVYVFEAKIGARDNFHVRQLYYPLRMWRSRGVTKPIVPIFVTYSDHVFTFFEFCLQDEGLYNSVRLVTAASYMLDDGREPRTLAVLIGEAKAAPREPTAPFPQAVDVRKVIDVVDAVAIGIASKPDLTALYGFAPRQASYYGDAGRYLGMLELRRGSYRLTRAGEVFSKLSSGARVEAIAAAMLSSPVFRGAATEIVRGSALGHQPSTVELIAKHRAELSGTTPERRAQTVQRWLTWLKASLRGDASP